MSGASVTLKSNRLRKQRERRHGKPRIDYYPSDEAWEIFMRLVEQNPHAKNGEILDTALINRGV